MSDEAKKVERKPDPDSPSAEENLVQSEIGKKLKTLYEDVVEEEVPDRFLDLLDKLDKSEKNGK